MPLLFGSGIVTDLVTDFGNSLIVNTMMAQIAQVGINSQTAMLWHLSR